MCEIDWSPIITLIIGIIAAWVAMVNVRNNIRMNATMKWIDDLRNLTSTFINTTQNITSDFIEMRIFEDSLTSKGIDFTKNDDYKNKYLPQITEGFKNLDLVGNKLKMFIDPTDSDQQEILTKFNMIDEKFDDMMKSKNIKGLKTAKDDIFEELVTLMQKMSFIFNKEKEKANRVHLFKY